MQSEKIKPEDVFNWYSNEYNKHLKEITRLSKEIKVCLESYYTDELIRSFTSFEDFLDDINSICEHGGSGKHIFITKIQKEYFS